MTSRLWLQCRNHITKLAKEDLESVGKLPDFEDRKLQIAITTWIDLTEEGTVADDDHHEWDGQSMCRCVGCGYRDNVDRFTAPRRGAL